MAVNCPEQEPREKEDLSHYVMIEKCLPPRCRWSAPRSRELLNVSCGAGGLKTLNAEGPNERRRSRGYDKG
jgi:hypothetical protein